MYKLVYCFLLATILLAGCSREFLDKKPDDSLVVPSSLADLQALLDNDGFMNGAVSKSLGGPVPSLLLAGTDDYYVPDVHYSTLSQYARNVYVWAASDPYGGERAVEDWSVPYRTVFYSNTALEGLLHVDKTAANSAAWNNVRGSALFYRSHAFYMLAQAFAPPYRRATAATEPGIPLRTRADITEHLERATLEETYGRILQDLREAVSLLPVTPLSNRRPSRTAAFGLLARVYQTMGDHAASGQYADSALQLNSALLDYNSVNTSAPYPLSKGNEVIFYATVNALPSVELWLDYYTRTDSTLQRSYAPGDLRSTLFFKVQEPGQFSFRGSYAPSGYLFAGIATDELLLIRAEAHARAGRVSEALSDLNSLLGKRYKTGTFTPLTASSADEALTLVLTERRKELLQRGLRWTDLRRLGDDPRYAHTIRRVVEGQTYTLPPGDPRYTWPIPNDVLSYHPDMPQNPR